jgi:uncharacterized phage infection (PIP) family protein YhgE
MRELGYGAVDRPPKNLEQLTDEAAAAEQALSAPDSLRPGAPSQNEAQDALDDGRFQEPSKILPAEATGSPDPVTDGLDRVTGEYKQEDAAREDLRVLVAALDKVSGQLAELTDTLQQQLSQVAATPPDLEEQLDLAKQIAPEISQLKTAVTELPERGLSQEPDLAFSVTAQMTAVMSDLRYAKTQFSATRMWKKIWATLKRAAPRLWSLISHLVKVKEWSVTAAVGTGVLGLANASISVTFG